MFGTGIYFADLFAKAFNYTSYHGSYYAHGTQSRGYMAIFHVHIGKQYEVGRNTNRHYDLSADGLKRLGNYDSTWGKSGVSLINSEYVIYSPHQCTVAFLVELM
jgi:poly [ADP-ribose] polymerase